MIVVKNTVCTEVVNVELKKIYGCVVQVSYENYSQKYNIKCLNIPPDTPGLGEDIRTTMKTLREKDDVPKIVAADWNDSTYEIEV